MSFAELGRELLLENTKLAKDLHRCCAPVVREAPDEFRQLVKQLEVLEGALSALQDDVTSDTAFFKELNDSQQESLQRCLFSCHDTLRTLDTLITRSRIAEGTHSLHKVEWSTWREEVSGLQAKITVHSCHIRLSTSPIGNSSLERFEASIIGALERRRAGHDRADDEPPVPLTKNRSANSALTFSDHKGHDLFRARTGTMSTDTAMPTSIYSGVSINDDTSSETASSLLPSPETPPGPHRFTDRSPRLMQHKESSVDEAVADAMKELARIKLMAQSSRPLRVIPQDPVHQPSDTLKARFRELINQERETRRLTARKWLRLATWWLLRSSNAVQYDKQSVTNAQGNFSPSEDSRLSSSQAYVDILKASWILYDVFLNDENLTGSITDENRKLFHDVQEGIKDNLYHFTSMDVPDENRLLQQDLCILEMSQPEEGIPENDAFSSGIENGRYITVDPEDAGAEDEQVLFRTFVNAMIGHRVSRMRVPYMLLLSVMRGESEPKITICNQSGTVGLVRNITPDDFPRAHYSQGSALQPGFSNTVQMSARQPLVLQFHPLKVSIMFKNDNELSQFMYIPEIYFAAVQKRNPRRMPSATESIIFERYDVFDGCLRFLRPTLTLESSLDVYEVLETPAIKPATPPLRWESCGLRVLETVGREGWRTTRRIVVNSSVGEIFEAGRSVWCVDSFLPMSRVQLLREGSSRKILMKWSDCGQLDIKTDGNYNKVYSYLYKDRDPNQAISLLFRSESDATNFERVVLRLLLEPSYQWLTGSDEGFVYNIHDSEPEAKSYKAVLLTKTRMSWRYSEIFYAYRDADYEYSHERLSVRFPQVYSTDYISSHVDKLYNTPEQPPTFLHASKKITSVTVQFNRGQEAVSQGFMNAFSSNYELVFSRRVQWLTTKPTPRFGSVGSNKGPAEIQVWRRGPNIRVVSRWVDAVEDKWLTMAVPPEIRNITIRDNNKAVLGTERYERGTLIDMENLVARHPRDTNRRNRGGPLTIAFERERDREDFATALDGH